MKAWEALSERGIIGVSSDPALGTLLAGETASFYCGYDPSFRSLQIGNLFAIVTMRRLQDLGHRPVVLLGGGTGGIGDPSGRSAERNLLDLAQVEENSRAIRKQLGRFLDFGGGRNGAIIVDNRDWLSGFGLLDFLRDVGRRFRVGEMLARESVKRRMEAEDGISFTEFSYQILQAYDFLHLYRTLGVRMQMGGGDQWGNITAGIDLIRRVESAQAFGMTIPLVTDSQGRKFGKSTGGTVYLDAEISSPYRMYQFLLNAEDVCVGQYLRFYTFLSMADIGQLERETTERPERREAQRRLASEVVGFVHGPSGLALAEKATGIFFGAAVEDISSADAEEIFSEVPRTEIRRDSLAAGVNVVELLASTGLWKGRNDVRRSIGQRGAYLNNRLVEAPDIVIDSSRLTIPDALVVRKGKKNYALVRVI